MTRRDPYSWTVVRLPERDLAELVLELVTPLLERLGPTPAIDDARATVALAVTFWNADQERESQRDPEENRGSDLDHAAPAPPKSRTSRARAPSSDARIFREIRRDLTDGAPE